MAKQIVMDATGDTRHEFDPADAAAVSNALARFKALTAAGFVLRPGFETPGWAYSGGQL